jgi:adenylylsulfate kinase
MTSVPSDAPKLLLWHHSQVTQSDRAAALQHQPRTIWLTGLSGSGKSTLAFALEKALFDRHYMAYTLDGDNIRHGLCRDLGFSAADRSENIRRIAEVAHLMNEAGLIVITSFISPYREDRELARQIIGTDRFIEVFVSTPLAICEKRDPKGLYQKARAGELKNFTGISDPYEAPDAPDLILNTHDIDFADCLKQLLKLLEIDA